MEARLTPIRSLILFRLGASRSASSLHCPSVQITTPPPSASSTSSQPYSNPPSLLYLDGRVGAADGCGVQERGCGEGLHDEVVGEEELRGEGGGERDERKEEPAMARREEGDIPAMATAGPPEPADPVAARVSREVPISPNLPKRRPVEFQLSFQSLLLRRNAIQSNSNQEGFAFTNASRDETKRDFMHP